MVLFGIVSCFRQKLTLDLSGWKNFSQGGIPLSFDNIQENFS